MKQHIEAFEVMTGFETANKYMVLNTMGQQVFLAAESGGNYCTRNCCGSLRSFEMILGGIFSNMFQTAFENQSFKI